MRVQPDTMPGQLAETTRCYPRDLRSAFPDSEDCREGIELVASRNPLRALSRALEWAVAVLLLAWMAWAALHAATPGPL